MQPYKYECAVCHQSRISHTQVRTVCHECVTTGSRTLTDDQYQVWLRLAYARIGGGLPLVFFDCTEEGNKELYCSWGMCNDDLSAWPWKDTWYNPKHTVPRGSPGKQEVHHVSCGPKHRCPFDDQDVGYAGYGCFHRCKIFGFSIATRPTQQDALKLILELQEIDNDTS